MAQVARNRTGDYRSVWIKKFDEAVLFFTTNSS